MSVISKTITLGFLLLFSVQSFSYPVLLLRYSHHFDCAPGETGCHSKKAQSHCSGTCSLSKQLKEAGANEPLPSTGKSNQQLPEIPEPVLVFRLFLPLTPFCSIYPPSPVPPLHLGNPIPVFQPPIV